MGLGGVGLGVEMKEKTSSVDDAGIGPSLNSALGAGGTVRRCNLGMMSVTARETGQKLAVMMEIIVYAALLQETALLKAPRALIHLASPGQVDPGGESWLCLS